MPQEVDWSSMGGTKKSGGIEYVKFVSGQTEKIRPVGRAVRFLKFFVKTPQGNRSVVIDQEFRDEASAKLSSHFGQDVAPQMRYAINVIDRKDQKVKILECGPQIFDHFGNWSRANNNTSPGGTNAMDWAITPSGEGKNRKYVTTPVSPSVLTAEEVTRLTDGKEAYQLKEVYKSISMEDLIDKVSGGDSGPDRSRKMSATPVSSSVGNDDMGF